MSLASVLQGLAGVAGQGFRGYAVDRQTGVKDALARDAAARQAERDRVLNLLTMRQVAKPQLGDTSYAPAMAEVKGAEAAAETPALVSRATAMAPVQTGVHETNRKTDVANPLPVPPSFTPVTLGGGENQPSVVKPFNMKTGAVGPAIGDAKPAATRVESATGTAAKARLKAAISEMNNAHAGMAAYEQSLKDGSANINGLQQFAGRVANSFTHDDPVSMTIQSTALAALNRTNPDLARYIRRGLSFAEGESMISQRPSDFRTKMAAFLSTAASGASPEMIADIESRRKAILDPLNLTNAEEPNKHQSAAPGAAHPVAATREQQLWDAAVAKHGQAKVLAEYGPRPQ